MKQYTLTGNKDNLTISFTINDLIPIKQKRKYSYMDLIKLIDYSEYKFSDESFDDDYKRLYKKKQNQNIDFFRIKGTNLIVIPGNHVYPTTLTEKEIQ